MKLIKNIKETLEVLRDLRQAEARKAESESSLQNRDLKDQIKDLEAALLTSRKSFTLLQDAMTKNVTDATIFKSIMQDYTTEFNKLNA